MTLTKLSAQELLLISDLTDLAREASDASETIKKHFKDSFVINPTEIHVYHTEAFDEYYGDGYLTVNNKFKYHDNWWGGRDYEFQCDTEGIFNMLRSCYLRQNRLECLDPNKFNCQIENIDAYFRRFVKKIKEEEKAK